MLLTHNHEKTTFLSRLKKGEMRASVLLVGFFLFNLCFLGLILMGVFYSPMERMKSWMEDLGFQENFRYPETQNPSGRAELLKLPGNWFRMLDIQLKSLIW